MGKFKKIGIGIGIIIVLVSIVIQYGLESKVFEDLDICKDEPFCYSARVTKIIDGDTIRANRIGLAITPIAIMRFLFFTGFFV